jgi:hypothetical protein
MAGSVAGGLTRRVAAVGWNAERKSHENGKFLLGKQEQNVSGRIPAAL